jgi:RHS repeat-associated protein
VYDWDDQAEDWEEEPTEVRRFMYDDWRMVLELDDEGAVLRQYTWGLDLSGTRGGAGGIGGLLGVYDAGEEDEYIYFHDAQGNVGQVVGWIDDFGGASGSAWDANRLVATYEYAPYGEILASSGDFAAVNPFRFSTKYHDDETGLIDFGRRLYDTLQGRWINRDPIGELGGENLYAYVRNDPVTILDVLGTCSVGCGAGTLGSIRVSPVSPTFEDYQCIVCAEGARQAGVRRQANRLVAMWVVRMNALPWPDPTSPPASPPATQPDCPKNDGNGAGAGEGAGDADGNGAGGNGAGGNGAGGNGAGGNGAGSFEKYDWNNCKRDAMQHCVGAALLASLCGADCAKKVGRLVELLQWDFNAHDIENNRVGANYCGTASDIVSCCAAKLFSGELNTQPEEPGKGCK